MTPPAFDEARDSPLSSDDDILDRLDMLIDTALCRQVWFMFLDGDDRQLPVIMPMFVPERPHRSDARRFGNLIRRSGAEMDAATAVITYERRDDAALSPADRLWLSTLRAACLESGLGFRGPYLCHRDGIDVVPPDDYL